MSNWISTRGKIKVPQCSCEGFRRCTPIFCIKTHFPDIFYSSGRWGTSAGLKLGCSKGAKLCKFHRSSSCCGCSSRALCSVLLFDELQVLLSVLDSTDLVSAESWGCTATFSAGKLVLQWVTLGTWPDHTVGHCKFLSMEPNPLWKKGWFPSGCWRSQDTLG